MSLPYFSIVIPVYNRGALLAERISYLLPQTFADFEVIVVDDGSSDDIEGAIRSLLNNESRVRLIRQENKERAAARNNGINHSKGKYVVLFDSDDFMHSDHLQNLKTGIDTYHEPDFITTKFDFIAEDGSSYSSDICSYSEGVYDYRLFLDGNPLACNIAFKRTMDDFLPFVEDRKYAIKEDWMFLISNMKHHDLILLDKKSISMFDHDARSMRSGNRLIIDKTKIAVQWIKTNVILTPKEIDQLDAHENYFCGIHTYLNDEKGETFSFALNAIKKGGWKKKYLLLLFKSFFGRTGILKLKSWLFKKTS